MEMINFLKWFPFQSGNVNLFHIVVGDQFFDQIQRHLGNVLVGLQANFTVSFLHGLEQRYLDITLTPQLDIYHSVSSIIFHGTDVTDRMKDQRTLQDYFENATIGLHWVNSEGIIIWVNPAELDMLGYEEHEYKGQHISKFHKNKARIDDILARLSKGEVLKNYEAEMLCKDGSSRFVSINSSVLWEGRNFIHTRCFTIDVTAQKLAADAVRESEQLFKIIADLVPLVLWATDENGMCTFLNGRWNELTGRLAEEGMGNQWLSAIHSDDQDNIRASWNKSVSEHIVFEAKFRLRNSRGGYTVCYANAVPRLGTNNTFVGHIGILQDFSTQEHITASLERMVLDRTNDLRRKNNELIKAENELKIKNAELEKINGELSSFAHVASHDLQEPLRKIQTFTDRVIKTDGQNLSEKSLEFMGKIEKASGRMRGLIQDILLYSKANGSEFLREPVNLNDLLKEVLLEFEVKIEEKNAIIECVSELPTVEVAKVQFHQLFLNVLGNALKFVRQDVQPCIQIGYSTIHVQEVVANTSSEYYDITIADNGIGFETKFSEKIFEMFNRLHNKTAYEGTGIGLAICKRIVEQHGGRLRAEGYPGKGATFHIYLPI